MKKLFLKMVAFIFIGNFCLSNLHSQNGQSVWNEVEKYISTAMPENIPCREFIAKNPWYARYYQFNELEKLKGKILKIKQEQYYLAQNGERLYEWEYYDENKYQYLIFDKDGRIVKDYIYSEIVDAPRKIIMGKYKLCTFSENNGEIEKIIESIRADYAFGEHKNYNLKKEKEIYRFDFSLDSLIMMNDETSVVFPKAKLTDNSYKYTLSFRASNTDFYCEKNNLLIKTYDNYGRTHDETVISGGALKKRTTYNSKGEKSKDILYSNGKITTTAYIKEQDKVKPEKRFEKYVEVVSPVGFVVHSETSPYKQVEGCYTIKNSEILSEPDEDFKKYFSDEVYRNLFLTN